MRLLLAEDESALANALATIFKRNHYSIDVVGNGEDAVDYLETGIYDACIMDIMMPVMDGLTALKTIRKKGLAVPVLLLTAKSEIDDKVTGLDLGADDYLTKPFETKELLARVRALTRRNVETSDGTLEFGNLKLDRSTYELYTSPDKSIKLASKEFQMLEMMMISPSRVISVDTFMDRIWGLDSDTDQSVIWTFLSYIRRKLQSIDSNVEIKSSRGLGYSLEISKDND